MDEKIASEDIWHLVESTIRNIIDNQIKIEPKLMNQHSMFNQFIPEDKQKVYTSISALTHKIGYVWENIVSEFTSFEKQKVGIDFVDHKRKIFMELKTNYNTANHDTKQNIKIKC